jgi:hypothetical protein
MNRNFQPPSPTPFEEVRYGGEDAHEAARNLFIEKKLQLQDAERILEGS